jgi:hypothetical protein
MMKQDGLRRREFLRTSGIAITALAAGGSVIFGPDHAWAMATTNLEPHAARTLLVMTYDLFPHDRLGVQYYAVVVDGLDKQAGTDAAFRQLLIQGVASLDAAHNMPWVDLSDGTREDVLRSIEKTEFFTTVRAKTISGLYGNPLVYQMFGYGGPSVEFGGYINRGFDDIGWLPNI